MFAYAFANGINAVEVDAMDAHVATALGQVVRSGRAPSDLNVFCRIVPRIPLPLPSPHFQADQVYPGRHIGAQINKLLGQLGIERIALAHLPAWSPEWLDEGDWLTTFSQLRRSGKIADFGVATFAHDADAALGAVASGRIGSVQVMLNLFDPHPLHALLPLCARQDVAFIARAPFYHGGLIARSAEMRGAARWGDWRDAHFYPDHRRETRERAEQVAHEIGSDDFAATALRFCLSSSVSTVAVGMQSPAHLLANLAASRSEKMDPRQVATLATRHRWLV